MLAELVDGVIGVDTHRDTLTAAAVTHLGGVLAQTTTSADAAGYRQLLGFARVQVPGRRLWAVEGQAASAPGWRCSCSSTANGSSRSAGPSGWPPGPALKATRWTRWTRWTRCEPPARRWAKTTWPPHGVGVSGRRCACCACC
jgi:hypothetical protein